MDGHKRQQEQPHKQATVLAAFASTRDFSTPEPKVVDSRRRRRCVACVCNLSKALNCSWLTGHSLRRLAYKSTLIKSQSSQKQPKLKPELELKPSPAQLLLFQAAAPANKLAERPAARKRTQTIVRRIIRCVRSTLAKRALISQQDEIFAEENNQIPPIDYLS